LKVLRGYARGARSAHFIRGGISAGQERSGGCGGRWFAVG